MNLSSNSIGKFIAAHCSRVYNCIYNSIDGFIPILLDPHTHQGSTWQHKTDTIYTDEYLKRVHMHKFSCMPILIFSQASSVKNAIDSAIKQPSHEVMANWKQSSHNIMVDQKQSIPDVIMDWKQPSHGVMMNRKQSSHDVMVNWKQSIPDVMMNWKQWSHDVMMNWKQLSHGVMMNWKQPSHDGVMMNWKQSSHGVMMNWKQLTHDDMMNYIIDPRIQKQIRRVGIIRLII